MRPASSFAILVFIVIVAIGAVLTHAMYGISASWGSNWLSIAALVVATVVAFAIKVADQWDRAIVLRLGRFHAMGGPGLFLIVPINRRARDPARPVAHALTVTPRPEIAHVTDAADTPANRDAIIGLARNADLLFIEAAFAQADAARAAERGHLTTVAAGQIAREAGVRRVEPFHFSPRYAGEDQRLRNEVLAAFNG